MSRHIRFIPLLAAALLLPELLAPTDAAAQPAAVEVVHPAWFKDSMLDLPEDLREARAAGKTGLLVFFSTRTCSYCHALLETTFQEPDILARLQAQYDVIGLEVLSDLEVIDMAGRAHWAKDFAVQEKAPFTPTLVFYGEGGQVLLRLVGYQAPDKFRAVLDYLEGGHYARVGLREYLSAQEVPPADVTPGRAPGATAGPARDLDRRAPAERPLLVLFTQADCAPCERLQRTVLREASVRAWLQSFDLAGLTMDDPHTAVVTPAGARMSARGWADALGLTHAPALVFFDERGSEVLRVDSELLIDAHGRPLEQVDAATLGNFTARMQYVLEKGYLAYPQFQRWRSHKAQAAAGGR